MCFPTAFTYQGYESRVKSKALRSFRSARISRLFPLVLLALLATGGLLGVISPPAAHAASPGTVGGTTTNYGVGFAFQQYACAANGLYWVFYNDGSNWGYRTSAISSNGLTWSSETTITTSVPTGYLGNMAFYCNGATNTVYYAGTDESGDSEFFYRSGALGSNGVVTWNAPEATVPTSKAIDTTTSVAVDTSGDVWVAVTTGSTQPGTQVEVFENTGGSSWNSFSPFTSSATAAAELVPLTGGSMALLFASSYIGSQLAEEVYSSGIWSTGATTSGNYELIASSAVALGNTLELCTSDGSNIYYLSLPYQGSWSSPLTLASGTGCSITGNGSTTLGAFYVATGDGVDYVQSNNGGTSFGSATQVASSASDIIFTSAASAIASPGGEAIAVWDTGSGSSYSVQDGVEETAPALEQVTITQSDPGPTGTASVSGCNAGVSSIPMDGVAQTFAVNPSCPLTITVPPDQPFSIYRFSGQSATWTLTTGASGTTAASNTVYLEYAITASYSVSGGTGTPTAPVMTTTEAAAAYTPSLTGTATVYWLNNGAAWSVPPTLALNTQTWVTGATTSGTVSSPTTIAFAYAPPVPPVTTTTTVTLPPVTDTTTVTSYASTVVSTTTVSVTQQVPTGVELSCDQFRLQVGQNSNCTVWISTADSGTPTGTVSWTATSGRLSSENCGYPYGNQYPDDGQLQCQATYTAAASGVVTITATYSGDPYHASAADTDTIFVGNLSGNPATSTKLTCLQLPISSGQSTQCFATVATADGGTAAGTMTWTATDGTLSQKSCSPQYQGELVCQVRFTAGTPGVAVVTASYGSDPKHSASSDSVQLFVSPSYEYTQSVLSAAAIVGVGGSVVVLRRKGTGPADSSPAG